MVNSLAINSRVDPHIQTKAQINYSYRIQWHNECKQELHSLPKYDTQNKLTTIFVISFGKICHLHTKRNMRFNYSKCNISRRLIIKLHAGLQFTFESIAIQQTAIKATHYTMHSQLNFPPLQIVLINTINTYIGVVRTRKMAGYSEAQQFRR